MSQDGSGDVVAGVNDELAPKASPAVVEFAKVVAAFRDFHHAWRPAGPDGAIRAFANDLDALFIRAIDAERALLVEHIRAHADRLSDDQSAGYEAWTQRVGVPMLRVIADQLEDLKRPL